MTNDRAIEILQNMAPSCGEKVRYPESMNYEAIEIAIAALRRDSEPLTLEQIQKVPHGKIKDSTLKNICIRANEIAYPSDKIVQEKWEPCKACRICANCICGGMSGEEIMKLCLECYDKPFSLWKPRYKFCHWCGRPLTDEAWNELEKRIKSICVSSTEEVTNFGKLKEKYFNMSLEEFAETRVSYCESLDEYLGDFSEDCDTREEAVRLEIKWLRQAAEEESNAD